MNRIDKAAGLFQDAVNGNHVARGRVRQIVEAGVDDHSASLSEAITASDLHNAFTKTIRQTLVAQYADAPRVWQEIAKRQTFEDFKPQHLREFDWNKGLDIETNAGERIVPGALARVPELTEYPSFGFTTSERQHQIHKNGARLPFSWESVIDNEWGFIESIPSNLVNLALNTEEVEAFGSLADVNGPNAEVFTGAIAPDNKPLTLDNLKAAKEIVRNRKVNGRRVKVNKFALVVPTALQDQAQTVLGISEYKETVTSGDTARELTVTTANSDVKLVVADVLGDIDISATSATTWYLVPLGGSDGTRTSLILGFLRNHEAPELRVSGATGLYIGGGSVPALEGSLLNDDIEYRVRHVVAGGYVYTDSLYASKGK